MHMLIHIIIIIHRRREIQHIDAKRKTFDLVVRVCDVLYSRACDREYCISLFADTYWIPLGPSRTLQQ